MRKGATSTRRLMKDDVKLEIGTTLDPTLHEDDIEEMMETIKKGRQVVGPTPAQIREIDELFAWHRASAAVSIPVGKIW